MKRGKFIILEGLDGSGKTTQIKRLGAHFSEIGNDFLITREPTNSTLGRLARQVLLGEIPMPTEAFALLFAADRVEHLITEIRPALEAGRHVICDRFVYSNMAFQGAALSFETIAAYNNLAISEPDLCIFIDTQPQECTRRIAAARQTKEIYDGYENAVNIRNRYLQIFEQYPVPVSIVDGNLQEDDIYQQLLNIINFALNSH